MITLLLVLTCMRPVHCSGDYCRNKMFYYEILLKTVVVGALSFRSFLMKGYVFNIMAFP